VKEKILLIFRHTGGRKVAKLRLAPFSAMAMLLSSLALSLSLSLSLSLCVRARLRLFSLSLSCSLLLSFLGKHTERDFLGTDYWPALRKCLHFSFFYNFFKEIFYVVFSSSFSAFVFVLSCVSVACVLAAYAALALSFACSSCSHTRSF